jgi:hypothetical protein
VRAAPAATASVVLMVVGNAYITGQTLAANGGLHFN